MSSVYLEQLTKDFVSLRARVVALETADRGACKFLAYNSVPDANATGDGTAVTVGFDSEIFDLGGNYGAGATFTAPTTDKYLLHANVWLDAVQADHTSGWITLITSNRTYYGTVCNPAAVKQTASDYVSLQVTALCDMDATDTAYIQVMVDDGDKDVTVYGSASMITFFCGCRIP